MRFYSPERRAYNDALDDRRRTFLSLHPVCWFCWSPSQCVHEIGPQGNRKAFIAAPCSWAAVCSECNGDALCDYSLWPVVRQLAMKLIEDPDNFDLEAFNLLRGRGPAAITMGEVLLERAALLAA